MVERNLAKVDVVGSNPIARLRFCVDTEGVTIMEWLAAVVPGKILDTILNILMEKAIEPVVARVYRRRNRISTNHLTSALTSTIVSPSYANLLGGRLKSLREDILGIDIRTMADILGFREVSELERYEQGEQEYPAGAITTLIEVFFIHREYIEQGREPIFQVFDWNLADHITTYLIQNFEPYFLLNPNFNEDSGSCYLVFRKRETRNGREIVRLIRSSTEDYFLPISYFESSGGECRCIDNFISAMLKFNLYSEYFYNAQFNPVNSRRIYIAFSKVNVADWKKLGQNSFYSSAISFGWPDKDTSDARDIFENWFVTIANIRSSL